MSVIIKKYKDVKPNEKHKHGRREKEGGGGGRQTLVDLLNKTKRR